MNWPFAISLIGSVASILGAVFAWVQFSKSKSSAVEAKRHVDRLLSNKQLEDVATAISEIESANRVLIKYGPSSTRAQFSGINYAVDAQEVQEHFNRANAHVQSHEYPPESKRIFEETPDKIAALANSQRQDEAQRTGRELHSHCQTLKITLTQLKSNMYRE